MKRAAVFGALLLALLAGTASASTGGRNLQQHMLQLPNLQMPPLEEFLPPLDQVNLPPLEEFLKKAGLPQWSELGLPPIQELLKPVGAGHGIRLPPLAEFAKQADQVMNQVVMEMLPPELKALVKVKLPKPKALQGIQKLNLTHIAESLNTTLPPALQNVKLPPLPDNLPPLDQLLRGVASKLNLTVPAVLNLTNLKANADKPIVLPPLQLPKNMPPLEDILKGVQNAHKFLENMPKPDNMPSFDQILNVMEKVSALAGAAQGVAGDRKSVV